MSNPTEPTPAIDSTLSNIEVDLTASSLAAVLTFSDATIITSALSDSSESTEEVTVYTGSYTRPSDGIVTPRPVVEIRLALSNEPSVLIGS